MAAHIDEINRLETLEIKGRNARLPFVRRRSSDGCAGSL
jgi:hypothetical protein